MNYLCSQWQTIALKDLLFLFAPLAAWREKKDGSRKDAEIAKRREMFW